MRNIYGSPLPLHPVAVAVAVATVNGGVKAPLLTSMTVFTKNHEVGQIFIKGTTNCRVLDI